MVHAHALYRCQSKANPNTVCNIPVSVWVYITWQWYFLQVSSRYRANSIVIASHRLHFVSQISCEMTSSTRFSSCRTQKPLYNSCRISSSIGRNDYINWMLCLTGTSNKRLSMKLTTIVVDIRCISSLTKSCFLTKIVFLINSIVFPRGTKWVSRRGDAIKTILMTMTVSTQMSKTHIFTKALRPYSCVFMIGLIFCLSSWCSLATFGWYTNDWPSATATSWFCRHLRTPSRRIVAGIQHERH